MLVCYTLDFYSKNVFLEALDVRNISIHYSKAYQSFSLKPNFSMFVGSESSNKLMHLSVISGDNDKLLWQFKFETAYVLQETFSTKSFQMQFNS